MALSLDTTYMRLSTCMALFAARDRVLQDMVDGVHTLDEQERRNIIDTLAAMQDTHTQREIAEALGISKKTLYTKRKKYDLI